MKNKKFLLTIAMIMSLVMAVSCGDDANKTTDPKDPNNPTPPPAGTETTVTKEQLKTAAIAGLGANLEIAHGKNIAITTTSVSIDTSENSITIKIAAQSSDSDVSGAKHATLKASIEKLINSSGTLRTKLAEVGIVLDSATSISMPTGAEKVSTVNLTATSKEKYKFEGVTGTLGKIVITVDTTKGGSAGNWS